MCPIDHLVRNFSVSTLLSLAKHGLLSSAAGIFNNTRRRIVPSDCICYPWLIIEHKKAEQSKEGQSSTHHCYAQAANAAVAALMMYRTLAKHATPKVVPPVVAMTTVGEAVRIWIAYCDDDDHSEQYVRHLVYHVQKRSFLLTAAKNMICIWEGDMTTVMGIIELETILENLHTWAMRVLRPWISHYIDQWKYHFPLRPEVSRDEQQVEVVDDADLYHEPSLVARCEHDSDAGGEQNDQENEVEWERWFRDIFRDEAQTLIDKVESLLLSKQGVASPPLPPITETRSSSASDPTDIGHLGPKTPEEISEEGTDTIAPILVEAEEQGGVTEAKEGDRDRPETKGREIPREQIQYTVDVRPRFQRSGPFTERAASLNDSDAESTTGGAYSAENGEETFGLSDREQGESLPAIILDSSREPGNRESCSGLDDVPGAVLAYDQSSDISWDSERCFSDAETDDETPDTTFVDNPDGEEPDNKGVSGHESCSSRSTPPKEFKSTGHKGERDMSPTRRPPESPKERSHSPIGIDSSADTSAFRKLFRHAKQSEASPATKGSSGTIQTAVPLDNPDSAEGRWLGRLGSGVFSFRGTNGITYIAIPTLSTSETGDGGVPAASIRGSTDRKSAAGNLNTGGFGSSPAAADVSAAALRVVPVITRLSQENGDRHGRMDEISGVCEDDFVTDEEDEWETADEEPPPDFCTNEMGWRTPGRLRQRRLER
jgi:hypothetical protein